MHKLYWSAEFCLLIPIICVAALCQLLYLFQLFTNYSLCFLQHVCFCDIQLTQHITHRRHKVWYLNEIGFYHLFSDITICFLFIPMFTKYYLCWFLQCFMLVCLAPPSQHREPSLVPPTLKSTLHSRSPPIVGSMLTDSSRGQAVSVPPHVPLLPGTPSFSFVGCRLCFLEPPIL
jgi:hypothetical protein